MSSCSLTYAVLSLSVCLSNTHSHTNVPLCFQKLPLQRYFQLKPAELWNTEPTLRFLFEQQYNGCSCLRGQGENSTNGSLAPQHATFVSGPLLSEGHKHLPRICRSEEMRVCVLFTSLRLVGTGSLSSPQGLDKKALTCHVAFRRRA